MASKMKTTALLWTFCWSMYKAFELSGLNVREMTQMDADTLETQYRNCAEQNKDVCSKLEYVTKLNMRQKISSPDVEKNRRIHEISTIDEATEYQTIFEDYIFEFENYHRNKNGHDNVDPSGGLVKQGKVNVERK